MRAAPKLQLVLLHDNARLMKQFLAGKFICVVQRPLIATFGTVRPFLLPTVKLTLNGERFSGISDIQSGVTF